MEAGKSLPTQTSPKASSALRGHRPSLAPAGSRARGGGEPMGTGCSRSPTLGGSPHPCSSPRPSSPYWETPPHATMVGALEEAAWPWQAPAHRRPPQQRAVPSAGVPPLASPGQGEGDQHPQRYGAQPVLSLSSLFLFLFFFCFGRPEPGPGSCHHHERHPPVPVPAAGGWDGTGRVAAACRPSAVRRRSLLLWPGPSALCLCPAVRLSCSPSPGGPRLARTHGVRSLRSGRSS